MNDDYEKNLVLNIDGLTRLYRENTINLEAEFRTLTGADSKEIENLFKEYVFTLNKMNKVLFQNKLNNVATANFKDGVSSLFDFFNFSEEELKSVAEERMKSFKQEDVLIKIKDSNPEAFKELYNDQLVKVLLNNATMQKLINFYFKFNDYIINTVIMFNVQMGSYVGNLLSEINYNFQKLYNDLQRQNEDLKNFVFDIKELRARRNIFEHNAGVIDERYLTDINSQNKKDLGKRLLTPPSYISKAYQNVINFYIIVTKFVMEKKHLKFDKEKVIKYLKDSKKMANNVQLLAYLCYDS